MTDRSALAVVVGSVSDEHLLAVINRLPRDDVAIFDAETLSGADFLLLPGSVRIGELQFSAAKPVRGWLRRLAPPDWQRGLVLESHDAVVKAAWLSLLISIARTCGVQWLTEPEALVGAENKLVQAIAAKQLGIATPETIVTNDPDELRGAFHEEFVIKPLGPGHFYDGEDARVVYTTVLHRDSPELAHLRTAPFLAQRKLTAIKHLRVVTVLDRIWGAEIDGNDWPLDWRSAANAHSAFVAAKLPTAVADGALLLVDHLKLGYSSQDWLICEDGCYVVDINPAGQWLFLPEPIASSVAEAIARWVGGGTR